MSILNLYKLREMARTRGDAMNAVLDWAAQQTGPFTYQDLYKVYIANGGGTTIQQFHSQVKVAKPWSDDPSKQTASTKRPFEFEKRGSRGKNGAGLLKWGLDGPLRNAPAPSEPTRKTQGTGEGEDDRLGQLLDDLENSMAKRLGGDKAGARQHLRTMFDRWKKMSDPLRIASDIESTLPGPYRHRAMAAVWAMRGNKDPQATKDRAEDELSGDAPATPPSSPFRAPQPKAKPPATPASEPTSSDDDDEDMGPGWRTVPNDEDDSEFDDSAVPDDAFDDNEAPAKSDEREYPSFLPDPDDDGSQYENAMFRIFSETDPVIDEYDPIWEKIKAAKTNVEARSIIAQSKIPANLQRSALLVAKAIFTKTGRDWDTGKKLGESTGLMRLYAEIAPAAAPAGRDPIDFDQTSGLSRILKLK